MTTPLSAALPDFKSMTFIGKGAWSSVYREKISDDSFVAHKVIHPNEKGQVQMVEREIEILKKLDHPNVLRLKGIIAAGDTWDIITQCDPDAIDLFELMKKNGALKSAYVMQIFGQLVSALKYCHDQGIVHLDVKPDNILVNLKTLQITLIDFGLGRIISNENKLMNTPLGSMHFISPEIVAKQPFDPKLSDIWSLGVTLYILATGGYPFHDKNEAIMCQNISFGLYTPLPKCVIPEIAELIESMLKIVPADRISLEDLIKKPFCQTYRQFFTPIARGLTTPSPSPSSSTTPSPSPSPSPVNEDNPEPKRVKRTESNE